MILLMLLVTLSESVEMSTPKSTQLSVYCVQKVMEINSKQCGIWLFFSGLGGNWPGTLDPLAPPLIIYNEMKISFFFFFFLFSFLNLKFIYI